MTQQKIADKVNISLIPKESIEYFLSIWREDNNYFAEWPLNKIKCEARMWYDTLKYLYIYALQDVGTGNVFVGVTEDIFSSIDRYNVTNIQRGGTKLYVACSVMLPPFRNFNAEHIMHCYDINSRGSLHEIIGKIISVAWSNGLPVFVANRALNGDVTTFDMKLNTLWCGKDWRTRFSVVSNDNTFESTGVFFFPLC